MNCINCNSTHIHKAGNHNGYQRYKCLDCKKTFDGEKYEKGNEYIVHFNAKIKKSNKNFLTRENYCIPKKEIDYKDKKNIKIAKKFIEINNRPPLLCPHYYYDIPNDIFEDEEHYTDMYIEKHYKDCMENFDLNMKYFSSINFKDFNEYILRFAKKNKLIEIDDLSVVSNKCGIYVLVLDSYKQVYIGKSNEIKKRILSHWTKRKEFARLLNGNVDTSILSIDSFGALDTTRIFYKELKWYQDIDEYEEKLVNSFNPNYRLNRVAGGINKEEFAAIRNMRLISTVQTRTLK